jgi:hypothetical protein
MLKRRNLALPPTTPGKVSRRVSTRHARVRAPQTVRVAAFALVAVLGCAACGRQQTDPHAAQFLSARRESAIDVDARAFALDVARDVTAEGPAAWRKHFSESPAFFMAADGNLQFPDSTSATAGIEALTKTIKHIDLTWSDDLRVDALGPNMALIASPYHEVMVTSSGARVDSTGFFTGVAEFRNGHWRFRNAHWSSSRPGSGK